MADSLSYGTPPGSSYAVTPTVSPGHTGLVDLGQNYPNPHAGKTSVPFTLAMAADVHLAVLDGLGRKIAGVVRKGRSAGPQRIDLNLAGLGLPPGEYEYQLEATTKTGVHRQSKRMSTV